jgi:hypothetical protein
MARQKRAIFVLTLSLNFSILIVEIQERAMAKKTIALPGKARIVRRNGKPREVILPIKEYEALHRLIEDLRDSLEIQRAKNLIKAGRDGLVPYREVRKSLRAKGKV